MLLNTAMIYCLYTLVDITATGHYKSRNDLERLQQQNFDTVMQTIGLAGNIYYERAPEIQQQIYLATASRSVGTLNGAWKLSTYLNKMVTNLLV